ncbi:hypothetical protein PHYPSEUDO_007911 [Phytophthora pseudosyringae]|uniref:DOT1 domain-containing protein n=1 Tax=Phytophthora pseudosyringae TaxID=221518 RepID=A0A8T1VF92_9STRA|nr:hypothetical protein PHYPSEUDO_007911 [Phytophthora pseudosyringae]
MGLLGTPDDQQTFRRVSLAAAPSFKEYFEGEHSIAAVVTYVGVVELAEVTLDVALLATVAQDSAKIDQDSAELPKVAPELSAVVSKVVEHADELERSAPDVVGLVVDALGLTDLAEGGVERDKASEVDGGLSGAGHSCGEVGGAGDGMAADGVREGYGRLHGADEERSVRDGSCGGDHGTADASSRINYLCAHDEAARKMAVIFGDVNARDVHQQAGRMHDTAGEILPGGIAAMIEAIGFLKEDGVFIYVRAGIGNVLAQVALYTNVGACVGVELRG